MNSARLLVPPRMAARLHAMGRFPAAFATRFFVLLLLGFLWLIPAWWSPRLVAALIIWDLLVMAGFAVDLWNLPKPKELEGARGWEHAPSLGSEGQVTLTVQNFSGTAVRCHLTDETPAPLRNGPPLLTMTVEAQQIGTARYKVLPRERGDVKMGRLYIRYSSRFCLAERWAVAELSQSVCVLPDVEQARRQALYLIRSRQVEMEKRRKRQRGQGREFQSLREYRQGDELRDICWTATARRHQLTTRIFETERSQAVWILVDAGRLLRTEVHQESGDIRLAKLDYAANAALSLAQVATQCGDRVGLLAYGRNIQHSVAPGRGASHLRAIVDCLAHVHGEAAEADHARAARVLLTEQSRRSLVVWMTDFAETPTTPEVIECAMQITKRHLVVFATMNQPDLMTLAAKIPESIAEMYRHTAALEIAQRRDLLMRSLRQRGVLAFELVPGLLASSIVNQYLNIKERSLL
jgi:uncharacterized protein (DUF58 family)